MAIFWQRWLTLWSIGIVVFGLILYGVGYPATTSLAGSIFAALGNPLPDGPDRYLRFTTSLMGAVTAGWGLTLYAAFRALWAADSDPTTSTWRRLTLAMIVWFVIDSGASIANGFALNAGSNVVLMIAYLVPVLASRVMFPPAPAAQAHHRPELSA